MRNIHEGSSMTNVTSFRHQAAAIVLVLLVLSTTAWSQGSQADYERSSALRKQTQDKVVGGSVKPFWLPDGRGLWYLRNIKDGHQFILADAAHHHAATAAALGVSPAFSN